MVKLRICEGVATKYLFCNYTRLSVSPRVSLLALLKASKKKLWDALIWLKFCNKDMMFCNKYECQVHTQPFNLVNMLLWSQSTCTWLNSLITNCSTHFSLWQYHWSRVTSSQVQKYNSNTPGCHGIRGKVEQVDPTTWCRNKVKVIVFWVIFATYKITSNWRKPENNSLIR